MSTLAEMIDGLIQEQEISALPNWEGAPLHFTGRYFAPSEFEAAYERWVAEHGHLGSRLRSHMWHRERYNESSGIGRHEFAALSADTRCTDDHDVAEGGDGRRVECECECECECDCVGGLLSMAVCEPCQQHWVSASWNDVVEGWHDHSLPGWRDLPVLPVELRGKLGTSKMTPRLEGWFARNYPGQFRVPGAPIRTTRASFGTRDVPNYSPFGGFDIAAAVVDE